MKSILLAVLLLATPALAQKATYTWKLQPPVGTRTQATGVTKIRLTEVLPHVAGMPVQGNVKVEVLLTCRNVQQSEILSRDAKGNITMMITLQRFSVDSDLKMNGQGGGAEQGKSAVAELQPVIQAIPGTVLTVKFTPQGKVLGVTGGDQLIAKTNALKGKLDWINAQCCNLLFRSFASRDSLKEFARYKVGEMGHPLAVGQSVSYSPPVPPTPGFTQHSSSTLTLKSRANGRAFFTVRQVYESRALKTPPHTPASYSHADGTGSFTVEESSGLLLGMDHTSRSQSLVLQPMRGRAPLPISASVLAKYHFTMKRLASNLVD